MSGLPSVTLATASNGLGKDKVTFPLFLLSLYTTLLAPFPCSYFFYSYTRLYSLRTRIPTHCRYPDWNLQRSRLVYACQSSTLVELHNTGEIKQVRLQNEI